LIIGSDNGLDWAIELTGSTSIFNFDVRNPDDREIVGKDLVEACVANERQEVEVHEDLFRGREQYRSELTTATPQTDVEHLYDIIVAVHSEPGEQRRPGYSTGWNLFRAISKRPREKGELFIIPHAAEFRIARRDGNIPFAMRLSHRELSEEFTCLVWSVKDALLHVLLATDDVRKFNRSKRQDRDLLGRKLRRIWKSVGRADSELFEIADILYRRDDLRRVEKNDLG
jgi:hypothetical protein